MRIISKILYYYWMLTQTCMSAKLNLRPLNFVTRASFSGECTQNITKIETELVTDLNMILNYKKSNRGRTTRAIYQCSEANKKMHA